MYELTIVLPGKSSQSVAKTVTTQIEEFVAKAKGKVIKSDKWGDIDLAYKIKNNITGFFLHFELDLASEVISDFDQKVLHLPNILRHLIVKKQ